jgi:hypothetical protein
VSNTLNYSRDKFAVVASLTSNERAARHHAQHAPVSIHVELVLDIAAEALVDLVEISL